MTDLDGVRSRVKKLLALSKSDNENEAASALMKANELLERHGLDREGLRFESVKVKSVKTYVPWRVIVSNAVAWLYGCHSYRDTGGERVFTGEEMDAFMASETYSYLVGTIERCARKNIRKNATYRFRQDFRYGMASRLYDRIYELGDACSWRDRRKSKIEEARGYVEKQVELVDGKPRGRKIRLNRAAVEKGERFGGDVSLARQAEGRPAPQIARRPLAQGELF